MVWKNLRSALAGLSLAAMLSPALADPTQTKPGPLGSAGPYCQITVTSVVLLKSVCIIPPGTTYILISNEGAAFRYQDDGTVPTASVGQPVAAGTAAAPVTIPYSGPFAKLQLVTQSGSTVLNISFYQ